MARLRFVIYGNEPGVLDMEISQAGSCNRKTSLLRVTNVIAHGPGIKLLNGLKTSTSGVHDLRLPLPCPRFYNLPATELGQC
jgi:hypothetical protein